MTGLPGIESTGYAIMRVLDGNEWDSSVTVEGYDAAEGENMNPHFNAVSPNYFATMEIPFLDGRDFRISDLEDEPNVCIVNETFARRYFPDGDAVGRRIGRGIDPDTELDIEIVGVVADSMYENIRQEIPRQVFLPRAGGGRHGRRLLCAYDDGRHVIVPIRKDLDEGVGF